MQVVLGDRPQGAGEIIDVDGRLPAGACDEASETALEYLDLDEIAERGDRIWVAPLQRHGTGEGSDLSLSMRNGARSHRPHRLLGQQVATSKSITPGFAVLPQRRRKMRPRPGPI